MTNPNSIVRLHSRNSGRASVLETNIPFQLYDMGLLKGNGVVPSQNADMNVTVGGSASKPDIVIAETPAGYKIALDIAGTATLTLTAPSENAKIVAIVAYTDDLSIASTDTTTTGNTSSCGLIQVSGTAAASPDKPTDAQIRTAITADGATGSQATYAVLAYITVSATTTVITSSLIKTPNALWGLIAMYYPIGSYYETSDASFDPNIEWGGTWLEDTAGKVLVAKDEGTFGTVGNTGGSEEHRHDFKIGLAAHYGAMVGDNLNGQGAYKYSTGGYAATGTVGSALEVYINSGIENTGITGTETIRESTGDTDIASSLQPYIVIKRWHRTA